MRYEEIIERLERGEDVVHKPHGNSMTPIIKSGQRIVISPLKELIQKGDVGLARVQGRYMIHKVTAIAREGRINSYQISNNHGHVNGWTRKVYGKVTEIG
jgi:phage repressor protein C with HTH and peptisase S24 domain